MDPSDPQRDSRSSRLSAWRRSITDRALTSTKLRPRDWVGDAVITMAAGLALVASVFLPWANENVSGNLNLSFSKPAQINGILATEFGLPVLIAGLAVATIGLTMLVFGPNRFAVPLGLGIIFAGGVVMLIVDDAAHSIMAVYDGGWGLVLAFITAAVLPIVGLASAMVGAILSARARRDRLSETAAGV